MSINIQRAEKKINDQEWLFFLTGGVTISGEDTEPNPDSELISSSSWQQFSALESLSSLKV